VLKAHESMSEVQVALAEEFRSAIDDASARIAAVLDPACPTAEFLAALEAELRQAASDPASVPYPDLIDPESYWEASVKPQARAIRSSVVTILEWLESRVINTMEVAEADLKQMVDTAAADPGLEPETTRADLQVRLEERCGALRHQMAELLAVLPSREPLDSARSSYHESLRAAAASDVDGLKVAYLRDAGGDESHQRFAEQQWSETYSDRIAHREAMLSAATPWRHQELALVGYERARTEVEELVEAAVARLQAPLGGLTGLLIVRFDTEVDTGLG